MGDVMDSVTTGDLELLKTLLDKGADINTKDRGQSTLLMNAVMRRRTDIVEYLIEKGADINCQDSVGFSALHYAAQELDYEICILLLNAGVMVDLQDKCGKTALSVATFNCEDHSGDVIKLLLQHGADRHLKNHYGTSPWDLACNIANYNVKQHYED